jgi:hypothetical protein
MSRPSALAVLRLIHPASALSRTQFCDKGFLGRTIWGRWYGSVKLHEPLEWAPQVAGWLMEALLTLLLIGVAIWWIWRNHQQAAGEGQGRHSHYPGQRDGDQEQEQSKRNPIRVQEGGAPLRNGGHGPFDIVVAAVAKSLRPRGVSWRTLGIVGGVLHDLARHNQGNYSREAITQKAETVIGQHLPALVRMRQQRVRHDAYGKELFGDWREAIEYFITAHIEPLLTQGEQFGFVASVRSEIADMIDRRVEEERKRNPAFQIFAGDMTGSEFEAYCAEQLRRAGWDARTTKKSRDQGVDVIAEKDGVRVVLQCKLYSKPVGNKAVQEAAAAKGYEAAHHGVVVSNQTFTKDAEQLAFTIKIFLIHHTDLSRLHNIVRMGSARYYD